MSVDGLEQDFKILIKILNYGLILAVIKCKLFMRLQPRETKLQGVRSFLYPRTEAEIRPSPCTTKPQQGQYTLGLFYFCCVLLEHCWHFIFYLNVYCWLSLEARHVLGRAVRSCYSVARLGWQLSRLTASCLGLPSSSSSSYKWFHPVVSPTGNYILCLWSGGVLCCYSHFRFSTCSSLVVASRNLVKTLPRNYCSSVSCGANCVAHSGLMRANKMTAIASCWLS